MTNILKGTKIQSGFEMKSIFEPKIDYKIARNATILLILLIIPTSFFHELGHGIVCSLEGNQYQMNVGINGSSLQCFGNLTYHLAFYLTGGLFAMTLTLLPFVKFSWIKSKPWIMIPCLALAFGHGINALIETVFTSWYLQNNIIFQITLNFISFSIYVGLLILLGKQK